MRDAGAAGDPSRKMIETLCALPGLGDAERQVLTKTIEGWGESHRVHGVGTPEGRAAFDRISWIAPVLVELAPQLDLKTVLPEINRLNPNHIIERIRNVRALRSPDFPYCTLPEFHDVNAATLAVLIKHKATLAETGSLAQPLESAGWLRSWVTTYPEFPRDPEREADGGNLPFTKMGPEKLRALRLKLVELKIAILREIQAALEANSGWGLRGRCLGKLKEAFTAPQFQRLEALDRRFEGKAFAWDRSGRFLGTLSDMLLLVGFFESELGTRTIDCVKRALRAVPFDPTNREYLEILGTRDHKAVADALDTFERSLVKQDETFWPEFRDSVDRALEEDFDHKVPLLLRVPGRFREDSRLLFEGLARLQRESLITAGRSMGASTLIPLTESQRQDSIEKGFKYEGTLTVGLVRGSKSNGEVSLHGRRAVLTPELFRTLLRLVVEAKKGSGRYVDLKDVAHPAQQLGQIKKALGEDGGKVIETKRKSGTRLSLHRRLIQCDTQALLQHESAEVRRLATLLENIK